MEDKKTIASLISYQSGSVVSKSLLAKKGGNITLFAFDKDQGLSEHSAPFDAFVVILDGRAKITISGKVHELAAGEMIIMPANEPHALNALQSFKMLLTMIKSD